MIIPARAAVRPRVVLPETGDTIPLDDLLSDFRGRPGEGLAIVGGIGAGKSVALAHAAACPGEDRNITFLDEPTLAEIFAALSTGPAVVATARASGQLPLPMLFSRALDERRFGGISSRQAPAAVRIRDATAGGFVRSSHAWQSGDLPGGTGSNGRRRKRCYGGQRFAPRGPRRPGDRENVDGRPRVRPGQSRTRCRGRERGIEKAAGRREQRPRVSPFAPRYGLAAPCG